MTDARLWLVRHGETEWSRSGRHTGRTDIALTTHGREEARRAGAALAGLDPALVLVSPMQRAQETAELAGLHPDAVDTDLLEWDYGAWEGITTPEICARLSDPTWTIWDHPIPAGATPGEQLADVGARVDRVIARCTPVLIGGRDCVLVAHGHVLRILAARWLGLPPVDGRLFALDSARVSALGFEHDTHVIRTWNEATHAP